MNEEHYTIDACGGPYYNQGETIKKGEVIGRDENGDEVISKTNGVVCAVGFDGINHCFDVKIVEE